MPRTRSGSAHRKVLDATMQLVAECGVDATSMDAIAGRSGVSKATIYKHWKDKEALLLEMMSDLHGLHTRPTFDSGNTRADMVAVLAYRPPENAEMRERILPHFVAYSASNAAFGLAWRKRVMEPPLRELKHLMKLGIERGEFAPGLNIELSLALLLGPMLYWHMFLKGPGDERTGIAEGVIDAFWKAFALKKQRR